MTVNVSFDQGEMRQVARGTTLEQLLVTLPPRWSTARCRSWIIRSTAKAALNGWIITAA